MKLQGDPDKKERRHKAAPRTPAKGQNRTALGRRSRAGSVVEALLLSFKGPKTQFAVFEEAEPDTHQVKLSHNSRGSRTALVGFTPQGSMLDCRLTCRQLLHYPV